MPLPYGVVIPNTPEHFLLIVKAAFVTRIVTYAAFTLMIFDMFLTIQQEVSHVWTAKFSVIKAIFLFNRYVTPVVIVGNVYTLSGYAQNLTDLGCRVWLLTSNSLEMTCLSFVSFIILLRLHAMWEASKRTLYILLSIWVAASLSSLGMMIHTFYLHRRFVYYEDRLNLCFAIIPQVWLLWLPDSVLHGFFMIFLIYKAIATPRSAQTRLLAIMYQDGIIYYSVTFFSLTYAVLTWALADHVWLGVPIYSSWMFIQVATSRLLVGRKTVNDKETREYHKPSRVATMDSQRMSFDKFSASKQAWMMDTYTEPVQPIKRRRLFWKKAPVPDRQANPEFSNEWWWWLVSQRPASSYRSGSIISDSDGEEDGLEPNVGNLSNRLTWL